MALKYLSGADDVQVGRAHKGANRVKGAIGKKNSQIKKNFKHAKDQYEKSVKKAGGEIKKFAKRIAVIDKQLAVKSFLKYISVNGGGFATRLKQSYKNDPQGLKDFWAKFGKWEDLRDAINKGSKQGAQIAGMGEDEGGGGDSGGQAAQYEEGAKASVGIIKQLIAWWQARKEKKKQDDEIANRMADSVDKDPTIPKIDDQGNPAPATPAPDSKPVIQNTSGMIENIDSAAGDPKLKPLVKPSDDDNNMPTNGSFGLSEINSIATFLLWFRGVLGWGFGLTIGGFSPVVIAIVFYGSFIYLTRKYFYNAFKTAISRGAEKRKAIQ